MNLAAVIDILELYKERSEHFLEIYTLGSSEDPFKFKAGLFIKLSFYSTTLIIHHRDTDLTFIDVDKILAICLIAPFKAKED